MPPMPVRLVPTPPRRGPDVLLRRFRRVGLDAVLADLDRVARWTDVPGEAAGRGITWDERDRSTRRWWPQGITTTADAGSASDGEERRPAVLVSWYARGAVGRLLGARISVVDVDASPPRYAHVRLVEPRGLGPLRRLLPVNVHAGGIVWYGPHLFVAGSSGGIRVFRTADVLRVRNRVRTMGHRYVLPELTRYTPRTAAGIRPLTYSFLSLQRGGADGDHLVAGEYGRKGGSHRLVRLPLDPATGLLRTGDEDVCEPVELYERQAPRMQGAAVVHGTWVVTASSGEGNPGDLWTGRPGALVRHRGVLPTGPEDITHWPERDQLWTLTEWPGRRWVYPLDAGRWSGRAE